MIQYCVASNTNLGLTLPFTCSIPWTPDHTPPLYPPLDLLVTGFVVGSAIADGAGHRAGRAGRRGRGGRAFSGRRGRQEAAPLGGYGADAPLDTYAADEAVLPTAIPTYEESESREARRFSGRRGRNGRRNNSRRQGRRQGGSRRNNNRRGQRNQQGRRGRNFRG